jgi:pimeloyl-ACP methyl ester carboxylesterase
MTLIQKTDFVLTPAHGRSFRADARYIPDQQEKSIVIFVHGFKGFKDWGHFNLLADYFAQQGFVFIKLNLSHNGTTLDSKDLTDMEAFGQNNFSIELDDLDTLLNYLFSKPENLPAAELNLNKVYLIGHSRGGGLVILKAAEEERVKAVVGWAPISDLLMRWPEEVLTNWQKTGVHYIYNSRINQDMPLYYQLVEDFKANQERLDIPSIVKKLTKPFLIIHATDDETLPVSMAHELKANQPQAEVIILPEGGHTFGGQHPFPEATLPPSAQIVAERTVEFLKKLA